jgi:predicted dithiol-disulfide oxidoreductase (DUF899 family)
MTERLVDHKIVSESEWIESRKELLKKEKEFTAFTILVGKITSSICQLHFTYKK